MNAYTKKQIKEAGKYGEVCDIDTDHIINMLDECRYAKAQSLLQEFITAYNKSRGAMGRVEILRKYGKKVINL